MGGQAALDSWFSAAATGNVEQLKAHVHECKTKVNRSGYTALAIAITSHQQEAAAFLADYEAHVRLPKRQTALMLAASRNQLDLLPRLAATCKLQDEDGYTALMHAVQASDAYDAAEWLAQHECCLQSFICETTTDDFDLFDRQMESLQYVTPHDLFESTMIEAATAVTKDKTALHMATLKGDARLCSLLIPHEFNIQDANGEYFTMLLARLEPVLTLRLAPLVTDNITLLKKILGQKSGSTGKTSLIHAIVSENIPATKLFMDYELGSSSTTTKAAFVTPDTPYSLADSMDTITKQTYSGFNPFHYAMLLSDHHILEALLEAAKRLSNVALIEQKDTLGRSPLHIAAYMLHVKHMRVFLDFAHDNLLKIDILDSRGFSPIDYAIASRTFINHCAAYRSSATKRKSDTLYRGTTTAELDQSVSDAFCAVIETILPLYAGSDGADASRCERLGKHLLLGVSRFNQVSVSVLAKHCREQQLGQALVMAIQSLFNEAVPHLLGGSEYMCGNVPVVLLAATYQNGPFELLFSRTKQARNSLGETALMLACRQQCFENALLALESEIGLKTYDGKTALMYLASIGDVHLSDDIRKIYAEISNRLVEAEHGAVDTAGYTALMYAAQANSLSILSNLLPHEYGRVSLDQMTALALASKSGHTATVEALLKYERSGAAGPDKGHWESRYVTKTSISGLMMAASTSSNTQICQLLAPIQAGLQSKAGTTALMNAINSGNLGFVNVLAPYEHSKVDNYGYTALMYAIERNQSPSILNLMGYEKGKGLSKASGQTAMMLVVRHTEMSMGSKLEYVRELMRKESGIQDRDKKTALIHAIETGSNKTDHLAMLLARCVGESGKQMADGTTAMMLAIGRKMYGVALELADIEAKMVTNTGCTALMYLASSENPYILSEEERTKYDELLRRLVLLEAGHKGKDGCTALMLAVVHRNSHIIKELLPYEAKWTNEHGETMLMYAAEHNMVDVVELLVDYEGGMRDKDGDTALIHACRAGMVESAALLAKHDGESEFMVANGVGTTPLMVAADCGMHPVVLILKERCLGVVCTKGQYCGYSALGLAIKGGHEKIVKLLFEEAYLCMGTPSGPIELAVHYTREEILLELMEYYAVTSTKINIVETKEACYPRPPTSKVPEASLILAFKYAASVSNVCIMHLASAMLGDKVHDIQCKKEQRTAEASFYILLTCTKAEDTSARIRARWLWLLDAFHNSAKDSDLLVLLMDKLIGLICDDLNAATDVDYRSSDYMAAYLNAAIGSLFHSLLEYEAESCCICMDFDAEVILFPCKHMIVCQHCVKDLSRCPYCRECITDTLNPQTYNFLDDHKSRCAIM